MKKLTFAVAAALSAVVSAAKLDGIAARVDSNVITVGDVMNELRRNPEAGRRMSCWAGLVLVGGGLAAMIRQGLSAQTIGVAVLAVACALLGRGTK